MIRQTLREVRYLVGRAERFRALPPARRDHQEEFDLRTETVQRLRSLADWLEFEGVMQWHDTGK